MLVISLPYPNLFVGKKAWLCCCCDICELIITITVEVLVCSPMVLPDNNIFAVLLSLGVDI
jgi:hypothetical protein